MADPRSKLGAASDKSEFFRTLGKIGDIEALNSVDSDIGQGLRALETISNQLRTGDGPVAKIWNSVEASVETGANSVYETLNIDPNAAKDIGQRFNPGVLNRAQGQAETIYERVRQGNFEIRDVPDAIQDFQNLSQLLKGVFTPKANQDPNEVAQANKICDPSPWAMDLIKLAPKHKFMFVVEFIFNKLYEDVFSDLDFAFVIKRTTRPNIQFEYEDINFYNFRSKVLKKMEYQPMSMTFYDDMRDNALRFYTRYLQIISPISRGDAFQSGFEEAGMSFEQIDDEGARGLNSSSINAVGDTTKTIIHHAQLYHIINFGRQVDVYRFENPRLQTMTLDDLDMTDGSSGTEVTIEFNYDRVSIEPAADIRDFQSQIIDGTTVGDFPITLANIKGSEQTNTTKESDAPYTARYGDEIKASSADANEGAGTTDENAGITALQNQATNNLLSTREAVLQRARDAQEEGAAIAGDTSNISPNISNPRVVNPDG